MKPTEIQELLGLASNAVGLGEKTAQTITALRKIFERTRARSNYRVIELLNQLTADIAASDITNTQLRNALKNLSDKFLKDNEFEKEKSRYELIETGEGDFVFRIKNHMADEQPVHYVCPVCINRDKTISFIAGHHRKVCQTDRKHVFNFGKKPPVVIPPVKH